ncbi:MAG: RdgB/HAM1 family non-canonical purine NTP pyrophosphatase [Gemmiger sp.]|nr:RdgB/HAM1 family non-canonical purine NTP pyrophosphatase [Gemmiger sp.]
MIICAATNNPGKLKELCRILEQAGHTVKSLRALGVTLDPEETGTTFAENAILKATAFCQATGLATVADDSGLCVEALGGAPGVYSARYAGTHGDDAANNRKLMAALAAVPAGARGAKFVSAVCLMLPGGQSLLCEGECPGSIAFAEKGENGFGYDPLFVPDAIGVPGQNATAPNAEGRSYAQLADAEKDAISHRGRALKELEAALPGFLQKQPAATVAQG